MGEQSAAAAWLESALLRACSDSSAGLQLDSDVVASLVSYCELAPPADAAEYLANIVADKSSKEIIEGYLKLRQPVNSELNESGKVPALQPYVKPQSEDTWTAGTKYIKQRQQESTPPIPKSSTSSSKAPSSSTKGRNKKAGKSISITEVNQMVNFSQGKPCDCQAVRHPLVNNCLSCGKIVCQQEGEGPCSFCGALVLRDGSNYAGLDEGSVLPISEAEAKAQAFKDRLVEYDRNSASRTTVIDDQSDYFQIDGDSWLTEEEKEKLRKRQDEVERVEQERRKRVIVTFDLLGRKVVMDGATTSDTINDSILLNSEKQEDKPKSVRIKPNPYIAEPPIFVSSAAQESNATVRHRNKATVTETATGTSTAAVQSSRRSGRLSRRVQHYEPVVEALLLSDSVGSLQLNATAQQKWMEPSVKQQLLADDSESFECAA